MVEIEVNGSIYQGRLISIHANEEIFDTPDGVQLYHNMDYTVNIMDANGVRLFITVGTLDKITFVG